MKFLFLDIDGTLLDFNRSEKEALKSALIENNLPHSNEIYLLYHKTNAKLWEALEKGEITREKLVIKRFDILFKAFQIDFNPGVFEITYRKYLDKQYFVMDGAIELMEYLKGKYKLYAVTNGTASTQYKRLKASGLDEYFDEIFISEEIGVQKPEKLFFKHCFEKIINFDRNEAMIIGDSLSSDIKGGNNANIKTCWFNRDGLLKSSDEKIDFEIHKLSNLYDIL